MWCRVHAASQFAVLLSILLIPVTGRAQIETPSAGSTSISSSFTISSGHSDNWLNDLTQVQPVACTQSTCGPQDGCGTNCDQGCGCGEGCVTQTDCCGADCTSRASLTNGLWGKGIQLYEKGLGIDGSYTHFYQGVTSGGTNQTFRNGGKLDLFMIADTGKLGMWEGGQIQVHAADWQVGHNSITDAAGLAPVNANLVTPTLQDSFGLTHLLLMQNLGDGWAAMAGRYNVLDLWTGFYPDYGRGLDGFMNISAMLPLSSIPSVPVISNVAGITKSGEKGPVFSFQVIESQFSPTTVGLDFPNGVTFLGFARKYTEANGLPGSHTIIGTYANGDYTSFDTSGWSIIPPGGIVPAQRSGTWSAFYIAEQRLWADRCNEKRYTKCFGYVGFSDSETSPFQVTASASVEAFGAMDSRPLDRMGAAYFYNGLNSDFQNLFSLAAAVDDVHGVEVYYNMQVTPCFNLTLDVQAVEPAVRARDTAIVVGLRGKIKI